MNKRSALAFHGQCSVVVQSFGCGRICGEIVKHRAVEINVIGKFRIQLGRSGYRRVKIEFAALGKIFGRVITENFSAHNDIFVRRLRNLIVSHHVDGFLHISVRIKIYRAIGFLHALHVFDRKRCGVCGFAVHVDTEAVKRCDIR